MAKTLILSDLHLSDKVDQSLFEKLKTLFESVDKIIMNGDFWDDSKTTFDKFLESDWNKLFSLMLEKDCYYIYGNHDPVYRCDPRVSHFSTNNGLDLEFSHFGRDYYVTHGQIFSAVTRLAMFLKRRTSVLYNVCVFPLRSVMRTTEEAVKSNDYSFELATLNAHFKPHIPEGKVLVMGHTHVPEVSLDENYLNTGFCRNNFMSYLIFEDGKEPYLVTDTYK